MEKSCGAIIINKNKVLLVLQNNGIICFPKGHIKNNEKEKECIIREIKEETNLDILLDEKNRYRISYFTDKGIYKETIYFLAKPINKINMIKEKKEIKKIMWVDKDKVINYLTHENAKKMWNDIYHKSFEYENIKIKLTKKQYNLFLKLVEKYKKKYSEKILNLQKQNKKSLGKYDYNKEIALIRQHNSLVKIILTELANEFKIFKFFHVMIIVTGSFARKTNKLNSDIDIHFLYNNWFKPFIWKYEEIYFCIISIIFNIERNNLHSVITTKLSKKRLNYYDNLNDNIYLKINMLYDNFDYEYIFYPVTKKRFYLQYKNNKSLKSFKKYIKKEIINKNREWAHNFYLITNDNRFNKFTKKNSKNEFKYGNITNYIDNIIYDINLSLTNSNDIKDIKKCYQQITFRNIFNTLNIIRYLEGDFYFDIEKIFKYKKFTNIKDSKNIEKLIYEYLWLVKKISCYCEDNNISYSIHKSVKVNIDFLPLVKKKQK